jgi:hypothetical protein
MTKSPSSGEFHQDTEARSDAAESSADPDTPNPSELIDPNLDETEEAFGHESPVDASVGSAVAGLHEDRAKSAAAQTPRASAPAAPRKHADAVPGLEPDADKVDLEPSVTPPSEPGEQDKSDGGGAEVSELTMLGVEEMLRRSERDGERGWRVGWIVAALIVVAGAGGLGFLLYRDAGSASAVPEAADKLAKEWVINPVSDAVGPEDRFSIRGLQLAIETADWRPVGQEGSVETTSTRSVRQTYGYKNHRVHATFHDLSDRAAARALAARTELPARAVRCDTKVVVLAPAVQADNEYVEGLVMLLENYRSAVVEAGEDAPN